MEKPQKTPFEGDKRTLCPICHCIMVDPMMDSDGHNMCRECIDDLVNEERGIVGMRSEFCDGDFEKEDCGGCFKCPFSMKLMRKEDFKENREVGEILNEYRKSMIERGGGFERGRMKCDFCGEKDVWKYCVKCGPSYDKACCGFCEGCWKEQHKPQGRKNHEALDHPIECDECGCDMILRRLSFNCSLNCREREPVVDIPICGKCGYPINSINEENCEMFCQKCGWEYTEAHGKGSAGRSVKEMIEEAKDKIPHLEDEFKGVCGNSDELGMYVRVCERNIEECEKEMDEDKKTVNRAIDSMIGLLEDVRKKRIDEIEDVYKHHKEQLVMIYEECKRIKKYYDEMDDVIDRVIEIGDFNVIPTMHKLEGLVERVKMMKENVDLEMKSRSIETTIKIMDMPREEDIISISKKYVLRTVRGLVKRGNDIIERGDGVGECIEMYERGRRRGSVICIFNLGNCYLYGVGVERDVKKAFELYKEGYGVVCSKGGGCDDRDGGMSNWRFMPDDVFEIDDDIIGDDDMRRGIVMGIELMFEKGKNDDEGGESVEMECVKREGVYLMMMMSVKFGSELMGEYLMNVMREKYEWMNFMIEGMKKDESGDHKGAFELYNEASRKGSVEGVVNCVNCYIYGIGEGQDIEKGLSLFKEHRDVDDFHKLTIKLFTNSKYSSCKQLNLNSVFYFTIVFYSFLFFFFSFFLFSSYFTGKKLGDDKCVTLFRWLELDTVISTLYIYGRTYGQVNGNWEAVDPKFGCEGAISLARMLCVNSTLTYLCMSVLLFICVYSFCFYNHYFFNNIGDKGVCAIADALKVNSSIQTLYMGI